VANAPASDDFMRAFALMDLPSLTYSNPDRPAAVEQHPLALASVTRVNRSSRSPASRRVRRAAAFPRKSSIVRTPRRAVDRP